MNRRLELHTILVDILGSRYVYFQPPESIKLNYPCIVYVRSSADSKYANNLLYLHKKKYTVTVIDKNPDSTIPDKIAQLPLCKFDRHFASSNLNHDVYTLYY